MDNLQNDADYHHLIETIGQTLQAGRVRAYRMAEQVSVQTRWEIGRHIVEFEQNGSKKAEYGTYLLDRLAQDLSLTHGKGFSRTNVFFIRKLYLIFPIVQTLSELLSWSHYCELLTIDNELERSFYEKQTVLEKWGVSELKRPQKRCLRRIRPRRVEQSDFRLQIPTLPA